MIVHDDLSPIVDLLANFLPSDPIDLLLHSPGGLPDAAETLLRTGFRASNRAFRVIVPASAKSAATLLALGADEILMGDNSQLGPIDPQVFVPQLGMVLPAKAVISAYDTLTAKPVLNPGEITVAAQSLNAIFVEWCRQSVRRSKQLAEKWLAEWMLSDDPTLAGTIGMKLAEDDEYTASHGQVITWNEAQGMGLRINHLSPEEKLWQLVWELYVRTEVMLKQTGNIKAMETRTNGFSTPASPVPPPRSAAFLEDS